MPVFEAKDPEALPEGVYPAVVVSIEDGEPGIHGDTVRWLFRVTHAGAATEISALSSTAFGATSKARAWVEGILGRPILGRESIDPAALAGRRCQVALSVKSNGFNHVDEVQPSPQPVPAVVLSHAPGQPVPMADELSL